VTASLLANRFARVLIHAATSRGFDLNTIYKISGISAAAHRSEDDGYTPDELTRLSRHIKLLMQDEYCGLTRSSCKIGTFELMCDLAASGTTLGDSLDKALRFYKILANGVDFSLHSYGNTTHIQVELTAPELDQHNFLNEWWLMVWWGVASWLIGENIRSLGFEFPHSAVLPVDDYAEAFPGPCRFDQPAARFYFDKRYLDKPVVRTSADLDSLLLPTWDFGFVSANTNQLKQRLQHRMKNVFQESKRFPAMEEMAREFCLSSQTMRRRLEEEHTSYRQIKEDIRRDQVLKLLKIPALSIAEITRRGGFSDSSALARAVKGWTGLYPKQYRELLGHEALH
jgi:AraC-like DNA-binding protein